MCSFFVLSKPQALYGITRQRVCNREAYVITEGGCNRVAYVFSLRLDSIHGYAELHTRLRRITSTLRVIGTRWKECNTRITSPLTNVHRKFS